MQEQFSGNALQVKWKEVLPHVTEDEVYLFGNPPYLGARNQTSEQKKDLSKIFSDPKLISKLDYVSGWFKLASQYIKDSRARFAFVSTNSINQGEQVERLWTGILKDKIEISFAYTPFVWGNNAKSQASVFVVIIGMNSMKFPQREKFLYSTKSQSVVPMINAYLSDGTDLIVKSRTKPLFFRQRSDRGSSPTDGKGGFILSEVEYTDLTTKYPYAKEFIKPYINGSNFINNVRQYCIWILNQSMYETAKLIPEIKQRIEYVRKSREAGGKDVLAKTPYRFEHIKNEEKPAIFIPQASSGSRAYIPMGYVDKDVVVAAPNFAIYDGTIVTLALLQSHMHMVWIDAVSGKLKEDYRYSNKLCYNTFPIPELSKRRENEIEELMYDVLDIREEQGGTLSELYGAPYARKKPKSMNPRLLAAHQALDQVVDRAYKPDGFKDDSQRLALLLKMYEEKVQSLGK